jgi:hypothetical protein
VGTRLQSHSGQIRKKSFVRLGYQIPLKVAHCAWEIGFEGQSHIADKGHLVTSNSDITRVIENAKDLITKEKTSEFKLQCRKDHVSAALETEEHQDRT